MELKLIRWSKHIFLFVLWDNQSKKCLAGTLTIPCTFPYCESWKLFFFLWRKRSLRKWRAPKIISMYIIKELSTKWFSIFFCWKKRFSFSLKFLLSKIKQKPSGQFFHENDFLPKNCETICKLQLPERIAKYFFFFQFEAKMDKDELKRKTS